MTLDGTWGLNWLDGCTNYGGYPVGAVDRLYQRGGVLMTGQPLPPADTVDLTVTNMIATANSRQHGFVAWIAPWSDGREVFGKRLAGNYDDDQMPDFQEMEGTEDPFFYYCTAYQVPAEQKIHIRGMLTGWPTAGQNRGRFGQNVMHDRGVGLVGCTGPMCYAANRCSQERVDIPAKQGPPPDNMMVYSVDGTGDGPSYGFSIPKYMLESTACSIGEAVFSTKWRGVSTLSLPAFSNAYSFNLLGDPSLTLYPKVMITNAPYAYGAVGQAYSSPAFTVANGAAPFKWYVLDGVLPSGLALDMNSGTISGTISSTAAIGTYNFTIKVVDDSTPWQFDTTACVITVHADLQITTTSLPDGYVTVPYSQALSATGGFPPYSWSFVGTPPTGLSINAATGAITGTPTATGTLSFTVQVTDSQPNADSAMQALSVTVNLAPLVITTLTPPNGVINVPYSTQIEAGGGLRPTHGPSPRAVCPPASRSIPPPGS